MSLFQHKVETSGLYLIFVLTIALRVFYWLQAHQAPWFAFPGMDPEYYSMWADAIIAGRGAEYIPFPRAPLYPYLLAGIRNVFGESWLIPRFLNLIADLLTILIIYKLTNKIGGKLTALTAALLYSICGASIYYSGEILMTSLAIAFAAGFVMSFASCLEKPDWLNSALSGMLLALLSLFRPNALIILPISFLIIFYKTYRFSTSIKKSIITSLIHLLLFLLLLAPVTIANFIVSGRIIPVSTQGGVNFNIGNAVGADGWSSKLPGAGANWSDNDAQLIAERNAGKTLEPHELSGQMWQMGLDEIKKSPSGWLKLELKKLLILVNIREIGNNRPLSLSSNTFPPLKLLFIISLGLLFPFALIGIYETFRRPAVKAILVFSLLFGGTLLLFFVNTRYRMPLMPIFTCLAAVGLSRIISNLKTKNWSLKTAGLLIFGLALSLPPWVGGNFDNPAQAKFIEGNAALRSGQIEIAIKSFQEVNEINPVYAELHLNTGVAWLAIGDTIKAETEFQRELSFYPRNAKAKNNLGVICEYSSNLENAVQYYRQALSDDPYLTDAGINLVRSLLKSGDQNFQMNDLKTAEAYYFEAADIMLDDPRPHYKLALISAAKGDWGDMIHRIDESLERDSNYRPALELKNKISEIE